MKNVNELRISLIENYGLMKEGKMSVHLGKELANTAGKILQSVRVELEYCKINGEKPNIKFLQTNA